VKKKGLEAEVLFFVSLKTHAEIQKVKLTNNTPFAKTIKLFSFVQWFFRNASTDIENF
jgi:cellobiose phosphorylase